MQYLIVHCNQSRKVLVDGTLQALTEDVLELEAGHYVITLDPPGGCHPARHAVVLANTTAIKPFEVRFDVA